MTDAKELKRIAEMKKEISETGKHTMFYHGKLSAIDYYGDDKKYVERTEAFDSQGELAYINYYGDDSRIEYYGSDKTVGFIERADNREQAKKLGLYDRSEYDKDPQARDELRGKVDAYQKQQALLKQKMAEKRVK